MQAGNLQLGDVVKTKTGLAELVKKEVKPGRHTVYNLEVHQSHTYYVSNIGVLAHNTCPPGNSRVRPVNNRMPRNHKYAGKQYPLDLMSKELRNKYPHGIYFTGDGFPDFARYAIKSVRLPKLAKSSQTDMNRASKLAGYNKNNPQPSGYTWHHHQDEGYMQLVPSDLHDLVKHTVGRSFYNQNKP